MVLTNSIWAAVDTMHNHKHFESGLVFHIPVKQIREGIYVSTWCRPSASLQFTCSLLTLVISGQSTDFLEFSTYQLPVEWLADSLFWTRHGAKDFFNFALFFWLVSACETTDIFM